MNATKIFAARLAGCAVFDPQGDRVGRMRDILVVYRKTESPRVVGLMVEIPGKRRVFLPIGRVASVGAGQIIVTSGRVNIRRFEQRRGELRVLAELIGRKVNFVDGSGEATIEDVALTERGQGEWDVEQLFVRRARTLAPFVKTRHPFAKGVSAYVTWREVTETSSSGEAQSVEHLIATYADLNSADQIGRAHV